MRAEPRFFFVLVDKPVALLAAVRVHSNYSAVETYLAHDHALTVVEDSHRKYFVAECMVVGVVGDDAIAAVVLLDC